MLGKREPHPFELVAKIEYNSLLDELRKADDYLQSEYEKAKRNQSLGFNSGSAMGSRQSYSIHHRNERTNYSENAV